jgi:hypothetical protein
MLKPEGPGQPLPLSLPHPAGLWYWGGLFLSLISPFAGLTLGLLYARQEDREARSFGRWCVGAALCGCLLRALVAALSSAFSENDWLAQPYY